MRSEMRSEMRSMRTEMQAMSTKLDRLDHKVQELDHKVDRLDRRMTVSEKNSTARLRNSVIMHKSVKLTPLYSVSTGNVVQGFPSTLQHLDDMTARQVDAVLTQLEELEGGRPDARKRQLEMAMGITRRATSVE
ncbi:hypothetical protein CDD82_617 [Ophiocordyceps australis]|uniref:Uncharacterized protein n=1 Tax=Ophiocordyceps australis TaxID=1399860 RepID=A0A2C5YKX2_9HYPO|nr:hypothetical protein CDD82_617 [Ophiocordyceps australis]